MIFEIVPFSAFAGSLRAAQNADPRFDLLTNSRCLCRGCGGFFNSDTAFQAHRHETTDGRACRDEDWLVAHGWRMTDSGFWAGRARPDAVIEARRQARLSEVPK